MGSSQRVFAFLFGSEGGGARGRHPGPGGPVMGGAGIMNPEHRPEAPGGFSERGSAGSGSGSVNKATPSDVGPCGLRDLRAIRSWEPSGGPSADFRAREPYYGLELWRQQPHHYGVRGGALRTGARFGRPAGALLLDILATGGEERHGAAIPWEAYLRSLPKPNQYNCGRSCGPIRENLRLLTHL